MRLWLGIMAAAVLLCMQSAVADEAPRYNQVRLSAQASAQVSNDTLQVTLTTYGEERELARLAERINADMEWALGKAKQHSDIKVSTGSYQTWPLTTKDGRNTTGWRGQQTLQLESRAITALGRLAGELQEKLRITAMQFTVSDEKRASIENQLIDAALDAFRSRARIIADNLKARDYRIVDISVNTSSTTQPPVLYRSAAMVSGMAEESAVSIEGGDSDVKISVSGSIELVMP